jgi:hypothetical protein
LFSGFLFLGCSGESEGSFAISGETSCEENLSFQSTKDLIIDHNLTFTNADNTVEDFYFTFPSNENTINYEQNLEHNNSSNKIINYLFYINTNGLITIKEDLNATITLSCDGTNTIYTYKDGTKIRSMSKKKHSL